MKIPIVVLITSVILIVLLEMGSAKLSESLSKSRTKKTSEFGEWGSWSQWSSCDFDNGNCGRGLQTRRRSCNKSRCFGGSRGALWEKPCSTVCTFTEGSVRLTGALHTYEGRVEILHSTGGWGTICDNDWDINDAKVVCRRLGFSGARNAYSNAHFGEGSGNIWISNVTCRGHESLLRQCRFVGYGNTGCSHADDASVACNE